MNACKYCYKSEMLNLHRAWIFPYRYYIAACLATSGSVIAFGDGHAAGTASHPFLLLRGLRPEHWQRRLPAVCLAHEPHGDEQQTQTVRRKLVIEDPASLSSVFVLPCGDCQCAMRSDLDQKEMRHEAAQHEEGYRSQAEIPG